MATVSRKEQKERTRLVLVGNAERLFTDHGISSTATADVAKASSVSHGTVFVHFPTRDELVLAVVEQFGERLSEELGRSIPDDLPLDQMLRAHLRVLAAHEDFYARLISEAPFLPQGARGLFVSMNSFLSYKFYAAAQKMMKEGTVKKMPQAPFFNTWIALVNHLVMNRDLLSAKTPILKELGDQILQQFFLLIKTEERK